MSFTPDLLDVFTVESDKLENLVNTANIDESLPVDQIIKLYYQITNVSSMITVVKQQIDQSNDAVKKILNTEKFISEKFNSTIHPKIIQSIANSISEITANLQSLNSEQKSANAIETEAKLYEKLREIMSTQEFVKQYDVSLSDD